MAEAKILELKQQFLLDGIDGELLLFANQEETKIHGRCRSSSLKVPGETLLEGVEFILDVDGKTGALLVEQLKAKSSILSSTPTLFLAKTIHLKEENSLFDAKLMQNGKDLVLVKAIAPTTLQEWKAEVQLSKELPVQGRFETYLFVDPVKSFISLESYSQEGEFGGAP